jgi:hypothetical protein
MVRAGIARNGTQYAQLLAQMARLTGLQDSLNQFSPRALVQPVPSEAPVAPGRPST